MNERLQHDVDHPQMVLLVVKLLLEIDKVAVHALQSLREKACELVGDVRARVQKLSRVIDHVCTACGQGADGCGMRDIEKYRGFAED